MILCCGEALIDMLPRQTTLGEDGFAPYPGGAVFNTAIALGRLGAPAGFLCGLSTDMFADHLLAALGDAGVDASLSPRVDRPTTLAFVRLQNGQASYAFFDENSAMRGFGPADLPDLPDSARALFFGGISLAHGPSAEAYETLMLRHADQRVTMIDPNIRPGFIRDQASYRARIARMIARAGIVKLSDEDLRWLGGEGDLVALARDLIGDSARIVFLTEGASGARAVSRDLNLFQPARKVEVADTVGAGDTFNAGVLAALDRAGALASPAALAGVGEDQLRAALDLGVRAAAVTVSRAGANPPWQSEL